MYARSLDARTPYRLELRAYRPATNDFTQIGPIVDPDTRNVQRLMDVRYSLPREFEGRSLWIIASPSEAAAEAMAAPLDWTVPPGMLSPDFPKALTEMVTMNRTRGSETAAEALRLGAAIRDELAQAAFALADAALVKDLNVFTGSTADGAEIVSLGWIYAGRVDSAKTRAAMTRLRATGGIDRADALMRTATGGAAIRPPAPGVAGK